MNHYWGVKIFNKLIHFYEIVCVNCFKNLTYEFQCVDLCFRVA